MLSVSKQQLILIASILVLIAFLFSLDIKGLVKPAEERTAPVSASSSISLDMMLKTAKESVPEGPLKQLELAEQEKNYAGLALQWDSLGNQLISALYYLKAADVSNSVAERVKGAEKLKLVAGVSTDSSLSETMFKMALENFQAAYTSDSTNLDAKIGLATCYVEHSENPMQGISLLLDVVKQYPENEAANMNLGLFSMRSGQFEKAVKRFSTVAANKPGAEPYFYLGEAYKNLNDKENAIKAYKKAQTYITDPQIRKGIDNYINGLTKLTN